MILFFREHDAPINIEEQSHVTLYAARTLSESRSLTQEGKSLFGGAWLPAESTNYAEMRCAPSLEAALVCPSLVSQ